MSTKPSNPGSNTEEQPTINLEFDTQTAQFQNNQTLHTDADSIRRHFGVSAFDPSVYDYQNVFPNMVHHNWEGEPTGKTGDKGGTDALIRGKPGRGKSTLLLHLALRVMGENDEAVVWRGSTSRSEWLPFAPWARVCLPTGVDVGVRLEPSNPADDVITDVELDDLVREVVRYDTPRELNRELLKPGQFHVVYPDPEMTGCQEIYEQADEKEYEELEFDPENPTHHWWFAWMLDRVENGPNIWTTFILDEVGDMAPQNARKDEHGSYQKVELFKDIFVDARKFGLTVFAAGHTEQDIHQMIRHKIRWRIQTPKESNPTSKNDVVGFNRVPMETDMMSSAPLGQILVYNERNFEVLRYPHYPAKIDHDLKVVLDE